MTASAMRRWRLARHPPPQEVRGFVRDETGDHQERSPPHLPNEGLRLVNSNLLHLCSLGPRPCPRHTGTSRRFSGHPAFPPSPNAKFRSVMATASRTSRPEGRAPGGRKPKLAPGGSGRPAGASTPAQNPLSALRRHPPTKDEPFPGPPRRPMAGPHPGPTSWQGACYLQDEQRGQDADGSGCCPPGRSQTPGDRPAAHDLRVASQADQDHQA